ncbi:hypothetical protein AAG906_015914 [Vitis piasezkii]|uniref:RING-type domain-containing protein n=1 Tax=Vitis vinifera TaxID=29760 RepID=A0ABY9BTB9_VITVI|nr:receptor homology region, transmembrane domain- and RING domain-containing protein 1 [Vitis vinifera]WJZ86203.1 hypothetical protein VitviT2T_005687 [Vitis vinifera]|eukprot:XP_002265670.1 PREDICTED: receptor homology region, transmembrane domain- and RING domain-containing protein 1 [Vitis vinifera]
MSTAAAKALAGILVFVSYSVRLTYAIVHLKSLSASFIDAPARFAVSVNSTGICGALHLADPLEACSSLLNRFRSQEIDTIKFALIIRGKCAFEDKVRNAQDAGFHAVIVYDDRDKGNLVSMIGNSQGIWVPAVFVSKAAGETLKIYAQGQEGECCIINPSFPESAWTVMVISFISLLVIATVVLTFFLTRNRRLNQRGTNPHRPSVDAKLVEVLPCFTFSQACECRVGDTCSICLEDYKDGERLRVLPCQHEFHASCVDSWLTKWGTFCPVCKYDLSTDATCSKVNERRTFLFF